MVGNQLFERLQEATTEQGNLRALCIWPQCGGRPFLPPISEYVPAWWLRFRLSIKLQARRFYIAFEIAVHLRAFYINKKIGITKLAGELIPMLDEILGSHP